MLLLQHFTRQCTQCKTIKIFSEFQKATREKLGIRSKCKDCCKAYSKQYRIDNKESIIEYNIKNKERSLQYFKDRYHNNKDKISENQKKYYEQNRENIMKRSKDNYEKNREQNLIKRKEYRIKNAEYYKAYFRAYGKTEKRIANDKNQRGRRRSQTKMGDATASQILELQQNAKVCYWCKCSLKNVKVHIDHYIPLSKGGEHTLSNLVVSCQPCNNKKSSKDPIDFANSMGKLL